MGAKEITLVGLTLTLLFAACGSDVERTTGTITGGLDWSGNWPEEGSIVIALFEVNPWDEDFVPGPPAAFRVLERPASSRIEFAIAEPGVPFGSYRGLVVAWQDPDPPDQSEHMLPLSVYGTDIDHLSSATVLDLSENEPDLLDLELPAVTLYASALELREAFAVEY